MKTDLYTKILLTVIAVALTINVVKEFDWVSTSKADTKAMIPNNTAMMADGVIDVNIVTIEGRPFSSLNFPVVIKGVNLPYNHTMPVSLDYIGTKQSLNVDVKNPDIFDVWVNNVRDFFPKQ